MFFDFQDFNSYLHLFDLFLCKGLWFLSLDLNCSQHRFEGRHPAPSRSFTASSQYPTKRHLLLMDIFLIQTFLPLLCEWQFELVSLTIILTLVLHLSTHPLKLLDHAFPVARTSHVFELLVLSTWTMFLLSTKYLHESLEKVYKYMPSRKVELGIGGFVCVCVCTDKTERRN